jgi:hypothetical protein
MNFFRKWFCKCKNTKEVRRYFKITPDYFFWHVRAYKVFKCPDCGEIYKECVYDKCFYTRGETIEACVYLMGFDYENHETLMLK